MSLSIRDRAQPRPDHTKPSLEDGFLILAILVLACGLVARRLSESRPVQNRDIHRAIRTQPRRARPWRMAWWIVLVFIPASWLMGVTAYLTTDLAPVPLMWIIPLSLYLLSFILAFSNSAAGLVRAANVCLSYLILPLVLVMFAGFVNFLWIPLHLATFFVGALAGHGALARIRPTPQYLSLFYVTIALGGLLGGIWNALVAPLIFDRVLEYPLAFVLACLCVPWSNLQSDPRMPTKWLWDLFFAGVVFCMTLALATNQGGARRLCTGRVRRDARFRNGISVLPHGPAQAHSIRVGGFGRHRGRHSDTGC